MDAPKYACDLSSDEQRVILAYRLISDKAKAEEALQDILLSEEN